MRARATIPVVFSRFQTIFVSTSGLVRKKENTKKYRKLKMLKILKFLDNSYTRAYACKIIMHSLRADTGEKREEVEHFVLDQG